MLIPNPRWIQGFNPARPAGLQLGLDVLMVAAAIVNPEPPKPKRDFQVRALLSGERVLNTETFEARGDSRNYFMAGLQAETQA